MNEKQKLFLQKAIIESKKYSEIAAETDIKHEEMSRWWSELKEEREELAKIRQIWLRKCPTTDYWAFHNWHTQTERKCHYCGITEEEIQKLITENKIVTKRLTTRGRSLEIERLEPNEKYDNLQNLVYCCYWCNNAKTDEFTAEEFKPIGKEFNKIWKNRLNK